MMTGRAKTYDGIGVPGVRLYMETGDYVVTDQDGLFHFEDVLPGTHVLQIDEETLPPGYEPVVCEENSRYAGSAISRFVDAIGGTVWRANFYLQQTGEGAELQADEESYIPNEAGGLEYLEYDEVWLEQQTDPTPEWVYPDPTETPSTRSVDLGIKHGPLQRVTLLLNGEEVPNLNYSGAEVARSGLVAISKWRGVDIENGRNIFRAIIKDENDQPVDEVTQSIWFVSSAEQVGLVEDQSVLVADGRTNPVIAVRFTDSDGRPVHAGKRIDVDISAPYRLKATEFAETEAPACSALVEYRKRRGWRKRDCLYRIEPNP